MAGKTEWEDVLIKHGIMDAPIVAPTEDELYLRDFEALQATDVNAAKTLAQLSDDEDEFSDDDVLAGYRAKRMAELKQAEQRAKYGHVKTITKPEYAAEVNGAGDGVWVMLHLSMHGKAECERLHECMTVLSAKFKAVKFLRAAGKDVIDNFPAASCPTVLFYKSDDLQLQVEGIAKYGGMRMTPDSLEYVLGGIGVLATKIKTNPLVRSEKEGKGKSERVGRAPDAATDALSDDEASDRSDDPYDCDI
jgi:hypothetical protein